MKNQITLFFLISVISCNSKVDNSPNDQNDKFTEPSGITQVENEQENIIDTLSFEYLLQISNSPFKEIPRYHINKFIGTDWNDENDPYRKIHSEETDHYMLYDNYILTFGVSQYGVSDETILATFSSNGKKIDHIEVAQTSDMDISSASYSTRDFKIYSDSLIRVVDRTTKAKNYNIMPDTLELFDLDSTELIESTKYTHYVIQKNGKIFKVTPQHTILDERKLRTLSKAELRIKRNEFFARLGYIFQSDDLRQYFEETEWYDPQYEDVSNQLTAYDKYNILTIKRIEDEK